MNKILKRKYCFHDILLYNHQSVSTSTKLQLSINYDPMTMIRNCGPRRSKLSCCTIFVLHCTATWRQLGLSIVANHRRALSFLLCSHCSNRWSIKNEKMDNCHLLTTSPWNEGAVVIRVYIHPHLNCGSYTL